MSGTARLGAVTLLLGVVVAAGQLTIDRVPEGPVSQTVPVVARTAVCPDVRQDGDRGASTVTAAGGTTRTNGPLAGRRTPVPAGPVARDLAARLEGAVHVTTATGAQAGALVVEQTTRATAGTRRGVAALTCPSPSAESWFVGGATVLGTSSELLLVNGEPTAATVDVTVWTSAGRADPRPGRGIRVPPRTRVAVGLDRLVPDRDLLALRVQATTGRVASALRVVRVDGRTPLGTDWVPPSPGPAHESVVAGLPEGPGRRTLLVTNPGDTATTASVELTTADGQYVLDDPVDVPAGTSVAVDLSDELAETPAAVRVRSDGGPVLTGAVVVDRQDGAVREIAFAAATPVLTGPALLADVRLSPPTEVLLLLSATGGDAVVELTALAGASGTQRVEVPAATTVAVRLSRFLPPGSTGSLGVEVRPVSGEVHAARYSRERGARGPFTALLPVLPATTEVTAPAVVAVP